MCIYQADILHENHCRLLLRDYGRVNLPSGYIISLPILAGPHVCGQVNPPADPVIQQCWNITFRMMIEGRDGHTDGYMFVMNLPLAANSRKVAKSTSWTDMTCKISIFVKLPLNRWAWGWLKFQNLGKCYSWRWQEFAELEQGCSLSLPLLCLVPCWYSSPLSVLRNHVSSYTCYPNDWCYCHD